jgi:hypothetical protein
VIEHADILAQLVTDALAAIRSAGMMLVVLVGVW